MHCCSLDTQLRKTSIKFTFITSLGLMSSIFNPKNLILMKVKVLLWNFLFTPVYKSELTKVENRATSNDDTQYHLIQVSVHILVLPRENIFLNKNIWLPDSEISVELRWSHRSWCYCLNLTMVLNCVRVSSEMSQTIIFLNISR